MLIQPTTPQASLVGRAEPSPRDPARPSALPVETQVQQSVQSASDTQALKSAVEASNRVVQALQSKLEFVTDETSGRMLVKVIDPENNEVIRQIPSEEMLSISRALDRMQGLLVKSKA